jgi:transposase-like protein
VPAERRKDRHDGRQVQDDRCQLANKLLVDEHPDVLRESAAWMAAELMEAEVAAQIGAELGERTPERVAYRNGYRPRTWDTRVGELELAIPRLRQGSYFPSFLEPRRRAEQALVAVVQEAYVNGVSTRRVDRLVEQLGVAGMSKDQVSRLCGGLDEQVQMFRVRPLEGRYPYLWLDAKVERVREPGGVRHKALVIAYGVHETGRREVIGLDVGEAETEAFWREVLRDMLGHVSKTQQPVIAAAIRGIFQATSLAEARARLVEVVDKLATTAPKVATLLEATEAELLAFYELPSEHWSKLRSTNPLERVNREIGRRTDVVCECWGRGLRRTVCQAPMLAPRHDSR